MEKAVSYEGIEKQEFVDSVNFLAEEGYIYLRDIKTREDASLADCDYQTLEAKVTGKGIRLLGGGIADNMVDLGDELNVLRKPDTYGLAIDLGNTNIEEMTPGGVVIKKDLWLLDGSYQLNGTRILDAIRREEEL